MVLGDLFDFESFEWVSSEDDKSWLSMDGHSSADNSTAESAIASLAENARTASEEQVSGETRLPPDFRPSSKDVILARGARKHPGNQRLNVILQLNLEAYNNAATKAEKTAIVSSVIDTIREGSSSGGFVRQRSGVWYRASEVAVRDKVAQG